MDCVSDCAWNPRYNMFAVSGFGQEFPVLLYVYERSKQEIDEMFYWASQHGYKLTSQIEAMNLNDPQNVNQLRQEAEDPQQNYDSYRDNHRFSSGKKDHRRNNSDGFNRSQSSDGKGGWGNNSRFID